MLFVNVVIDGAIISKFYEENKIIQVSMQHTICVKCMVSTVYCA